MRRLLITYSWEPCTLQEGRLAAMLCRTQQQRCQSSYHATPTTSTFSFRRNSAEINSNKAVSSPSSPASSPLASRLSKATSARRVPTISDTLQDHSARTVTGGPESSHTDKAETTNTSGESIDAQVESIIQDAKKQAQASTRSSSEATPLEVPALNISIFDKFGMKASPPKVGLSSSSDELIQLLPGALQENVKGYCRTFNITKLTETQRVVIPYILEGRDVLCISPPSTGKTLAFLVPSIAQILTLRDCGPSNHDASGAVSITAKNVQILTRDRIARGELCKYCEMDVLKNPVCSLTGHPHRVPEEISDDRIKTKFQDLTSVTEPRMLIVVPTGELVRQIHGIAKALRSGLRVGSLTRFASDQSTQKILKSFEGCDILVSTPEQLIAAMHRRKLSLKSVEIFIVDEVDSLLTTNFFEQMKIILSALPNRQKRSQRLLFGATLPSHVHEMIRTQMLLPSQRFIIAKHATDKFGRLARGTQVSHAVTAGKHDEVREGISANTVKILEEKRPPPVATVKPIGHVVHTVFMLSRVEKMDKLVWLFSTGQILGDQRTIVFCNSRSNVRYVAEQLSQRLRNPKRVQESRRNQDLDDDDIDERERSNHHSSTSAARVVALSGAQPTDAREGLMKMFQSGVATVLVCTDVIARGIDFHNVVTVVHFDMPLEIETWVHRCGRCGRHGKPGFTYSFFQPENVKLSKPLVACLRQSSQIIPPKLQDYAKQNFVDIFKNSLFHHPTKGLSKRNPERHSPVIGRGTPKYPDYKQHAVSRHFQPQ